MRIFSCWNKGFDSWLYSLNSMIRTSFSCSLKILSTYWLISPNHITIEQIWVYQSIVYRSEKSRSDWLCIELYILMFSFIDKYYTKKFSTFYLRYSLFINFQTYSIIGFVSFLSKRIKCVLEIFNIRRVYSPSTFSSLFICTINAFEFLWHRMK